MQGWKALVYNIDIIQQLPLQNTCRHVYFIFTNIVARNLEFLVPNFATMCPRDYHETASIAISLLLPSHSQRDSLVCDWFTANQSQTTHLGTEKSASIWERSDCIMKWNEMTIQSDSQASQTELVSKCPWTRLLRLQEPLTYSGVFN